jgi:NDP-sugar pyrophosphorylase family protein
MQLLVLSGGKGTRLALSRKTIDREEWPALHHHHEKEGPKALAMMTMLGYRRPMLDWHLALYAGATISKITLGLGFASDMIIDYYGDKGHQFNHLPLDYLCEKKPAGTLASLVKMHQLAGLPDTPLILANGDNFACINLDVLYQQGIQQVKAQGKDLSQIVFVIAVPVPRASSGHYGTVDIDPHTGMAKQFLEKGDWQTNPYVIENGQEVCYISSGFSIIPNPATVLAPYMTPSVIDLVAGLEEGRYEYAKVEKQVKYETVYEQLASKGQVMVLKYQGFWADSGTEEQLVHIEQCTDQGHGLQFDKAILQNW